MPIRLTGLYVYPIKSCAAIALQRAEVDAFGLRHDRRFMVVDPAGEFLTLRRHPIMARARPRFEGDHLVVESEGRRPLRVPLSPGDGPLQSVRVWDDRVDALRVGEAADQWFGDLLGTPARLVWMPPETFRRVDPRFATERDRVSFADGFSLLLIGQGSLRALQERLDGGLQVTMANFRPNLVVDSERPFAEDDWRHITIGTLSFDVVKPCARCIATTVDPATGQRLAGGEPLTTLARFRTIEGSVHFGQNLVHRATGALAVGDALTSTA